MLMSNSISGIRPTTISIHKGWMKRGVRWIENWRQRKALSKLDDRLLTDIGITRAMAKREIAKPFWRSK